MFYLMPTMVDRWLLAPRERQLKVIELWHQLGQRRHEDLGRQTAHYYQTADLWRWAMKEDCSWDRRLICGTRSKNKGKWQPEHVTGADLPEAPSLHAPRVAAGTSFTSIDNGTFALVISGVSLTTNPRRSYSRVPFFEPATNTGKPCACARATPSATSCAPAPRP
jgi:hypothetical protein